MKCFYLLIAALSLASALPISFRIESRNRDPHRNLEISTTKHDSTFWAFPISIGLVEAGSDRLIARILKTSEFTPARTSWTRRGTLEPEIESSSLSLDDTKRLASEKRSKDKGDERFDERLVTRTPGGENGPGKAPPPRPPKSKPDKGQEGQKGGSKGDAFEEIDLDSDYEKIDRKEANGPPEDYTMDEEDSLLGNNKRRV